MYQRNGVPYTHTNLKHDNPQVGFPRNALGNPDIRAEYGITEISKSELPPSNVQPVEPTTPDGFKAVEGAPEFVGDEWRQTWNYVEIGWLEHRRVEYGSPEDQLEFITENGLETWQAKVADIKVKYPKS